MDGTPASVAQSDAPARVDGGRERSPKVFVVYGRNLAARDAVTTLLERSHATIISWEDAHGRATQSNAAPTVQDIVLAGIEMADAVVVVLTGDDRAEVRSRFSEVPEPGGDTSKLGLQPRQNVIYECGVVAGAKKPRAYVQIGELRLPSDLQVWTLRYDTTPGSLKRVCRGLTNALNIPLAIADTEQDEIDKRFRFALRENRATPCEMMVWCRRLAAVALGVLLTVGAIVTYGITALLGEHEFQWAGENWIGRVRIGWPTDQYGSSELVVHEFKKFEGDESNTRFTTRELFSSEDCRSDSGGKCPKGCEDCKRDSHGKYPKQGRAVWTGLGIELDLPIDDKRSDRSAGMRCIRIRFVPKPTLAFYGVAAYDLANGQTHHGDLLLTRTFATLHTGQEHGQQRVP